MQLKKNTITIDANVILRYLLKDNKDMYEICEKFFNEVFNSKTNAYILQAVLAEVIYVLLKLYKVSKKELIDVLEDLLASKNIKVQDKETTLEALSIFKKNNLDFVDCLICAYGKNVEIFSFDKKVNNLIGKL
ncbi:MAG: PIN domain-containing protein [Candidatus Parvarchaeota archaeon]